MFGVIEWKFAVDPILSPQLIHNQSIMAVCVANATFGADLFALLYYLPLYLQVVKGDSAELSSKELLTDIVHKQSRLSYSILFIGIHLMPMRAAMIIASVCTGPLTGKTLCYRP
jgi:hypothetical protein